MVCLLVVKMFTHKFYAECNKKFYSRFFVVNLKFIYIYWFDLRFSQSEKKIKVFNKKSKIFNQWIPFKKKIDMKNIRSFYMNPVSLASVLYICLSIILIENRITFILKRITCSGAKMNWPMKRIIYTIPIDANILYEEHQLYRRW